MCGTVLPPWSIEPAHRGASPVDSPLPARAAPAASQGASQGAADGGPGVLRPLLVLRILTVLNDNVLRWLAIGLGKRAVAAADQSLVLTIGTAGFVLPFVLLSWLSGWLADRFPKRDVIRWCKFAEILIVGAAAIVIVRGLGTPAVDSGAAAWPVGLWLLLAALVVIGCQAALLTPAVLGTIPEIVRPERLSAANGLFAMVSLVATLAGTAVGNWLADVTPVGGTETWRDGLPAVATLVGVAAVGFAASLLLVPRPAADPGCAPPFNALARAGADLRELFSSRDLAAAAAGSTFFWALGAMANLNVDQFVTEGGAAMQSQTIPFLTVLGVGIGAGSLLAGRLSTRGVNLGLVPVGAVVMAVASLGLWLGPRPLFVEGAANGFAWWFALGTLLVLGVGAGMFDVPVEAHFQERSPPERRGALLAALNLLVFAAMFVASNVYGAVRTPVGETQLPLLSARQVFGVFALCSVAAAAVAVWCAPRATLRTAVGAVVSSVWRFRVRGADHLPAAGPAVVTSNHVSWVDGFVIVLAAIRPLRMVVYGPNIRGRFMRMLAEQWRFILFEPSPKSIGRALRTVQEGLAAGDAVGIFCEGGISRTGQLLGFKPGLDWVLGRAAAPIVPAHIDGMWGSVLSFSEGRFFSKWPLRRGPGRRRLTVWFGEPLPTGTPPRTARIALQELSARAVRDRLLAERDARRDLAAWRRRHGGAAEGPVAAAVTHLLGGGALDGQGRPAGPRGGEGAIVVDGAGRGFDWAALAATAEAFDGCCLVRRDDRLVSSLAPGDPLYVALGLLGGPLLGIAATAIEADRGAEAIVAALEGAGATLWLSSPRQVAEAARRPAPAAVPAAVVMPIASAAELPDAEAAAAALLAAWGVEPVVAFAPAAAGGLVAMNTPPARAAAAHEVTCRAGTLGRVVNGTAVWPEARNRDALDRPPLPRDARATVAEDAAAAGRPLVISAALPRGMAARAPLGDPGWCPLEASLGVDEEGFLVPLDAGGPAMPPAAGARARRRLPGGATDRAEGESDRGGAENLG